MTAGQTKRLAGARVGVVHLHPSPGSGRIQKALEDAGAVVSVSILGTNDLSRIAEGDLDALVLVIEGPVEAFESLAAIIAGDPRLGRLSVLAVVPGGLRINDVAGLTGAFVLAADAADDDLLRAVMRARQKGGAAALATYLARSSSSLSHDALALTNVVLGYGANLRDEIVGPLSPDQKEHVARVLEAARDVAALVESFAQKARDAATLGVAEDGTPARRGLHSLTELVHGTTSLFQKQAAEKSITLRAASEDGARIWCDAVEMRQVVMNLVANAIKFTPSGGTVSVDVHGSATSSEDTNGISARSMVELTVTDSGPGIPPSERDAVFERGRRLARDAKMQGQGLGLAIVKDIVLSHGGEVRIEGAEGEGATFVVTLPVDRRLRRAEAGVGA